MDDMEKQRNQESDQCSGSSERRKYIDALKTIIFTDVISRNWKD